jgi:hypothetical protein
MFAIMYEKLTITEKDPLHLLIIPLLIPIVGYGEGMWLQHTVEERRRSYDV